MNRRTFEHLMCRPLAPARCDYCGTLVYAGFDNGEPIVVIPQVLDDILLAWCQDNNIPTYDVFAGETVVWARSRGPWSKAPDRSHPAFPAHRCRGPNTIPKVTILKLKKVPKSTNGHKKAPF